MNLKKCPTYCLENAKSEFTNTIPDCQNLLSKYSLAGHAQTAAHTNSGLESLSGHLLWQMRFYPRVRRAKLLPIIEFPVEGSRRRDKPGKRTHWKLIPSKGIKTNSARASRIGRPHKIHSAHVFHLGARVSASSSH